MILKREKEGEISCSCALRIVPLIRKNTVLSGEFITVIPLQMKPNLGALSYKRPTATLF